MCVLGKKWAVKTHHDIMRKRSLLMTLVSYLSLLRLQKMIQILLAVATYLSAPLDSGLTPEHTIIHNWYATDSVVQDYVQYAYDKWGIDFVKLIECENGRRDPYRISATNDHWICQLHYSYNSDFIDSVDFQDVYKQLDYCYEKYKVNPRLWYWPNRIIKWQKCTNYVHNRFTINV